MKRILSSLLVLLLISTAAFSQNHWIGIKSGTVLSNIKTDIFQDNEMRIGLNLGITYDYFLSDHLSLGAELLYNQRGFRNEIFVAGGNGEPVSTGEIEFNYDYLAVPLKISYSLGGAKFYGFGAAGLIPAFLVSAKTKVPSSNFFPGQTSDVQSRVKDFDLAGMLELGAGYRFAERFTAFASISGQLSFTSITTDAYFKDETMRHYGFAASAGVKFALVK